MGELSFNPITHNGMEKFHGTFQEEYMMSGTILVLHSCTTLELNPARLISSKVAGIKDRNPECEAQFHSPPYRALSHHGSPNNTLIMHMVISICHYWHFHNTSHSWQWFMNQTQLFTSPIPATPSSPTPGSNTLNNTLFKGSSVHCVGRMCKLLQGCQGIRILGTARHVTTASQQSLLIISQQW